MVTDALIAARGKLAELSPDTLKLLNQNLSPMWSRRNPVDVMGDARAKSVAKATKIVLDDKNVYAVLAILTPQAMSNPTAAAREISELQQTTKKPILASWLGGKHMQDGIRVLERIWYRFLQNTRTGRKGFYDPSRLFP